MAYLIKTLLVGSSIIILMTFSACGDSKKLWNEVTTYFSKENLTDSAVRKKMSIEAIYSVTGGDTANAAAKVKVFFTSIAKYTDYSVEKNDSLTYVQFDGDDPIAIGPGVAIKSVGRDWYITDVRFGK